MTRALASTLLCLGAFGIGLVTVLLAARNRARGAELDSRQRWCEIFSRQNEALRATNTAEEWQLLSGQVAEDGVLLPVDAVPEVER